MDCEICGAKEPDTMLILAIPRANGMLNTMACEACALKSDAYCTVHNRPHIGFYGGKTACLVCIEVWVTANLGMADTYYAELLALLGKSERAQFEEYMGDLAELAHCSKSVAALRCMATKAEQLRQPLASVILRIRQARSVRSLLPG